MARRAIRGRLADALAYASVICRAPRASPRLRTQLDAVLGAIPVLPLEGAVDRHYAVLRLALEKGGRLSGQNDLLIAAHALALDAVLVSDNEREFRRVPGLKLQNWARGKG
ncbi:MAG: PIN domain-containing protein [Myxococcota bacterium]